LVGVIGMDFYPTRPHHQFRNATRQSFQGLMLFQSSEGKRMRYLQLGC